MKVLKSIPFLVFVCFVVFISITDCKTFGRKPKKIKVPGEFDPQYILTPTQESQFLEGVVPNLNINETLAHDDPAEKLISVPGCPPSVPKLGFRNHPSYRDPWVYYGNPTKCYLSGTPGPCPSGMNFYAQAHSEFGTCNCNCFGTLSPFVYGSPASCFNEDDSKHYAVYPENGMCYTLMSQGPCKKGETFVLSSNGGRCERSKCLAEIDDVATNNSTFPYFFDTSTNSCKQLGSPCEEGKTNLVYAITRSNWFPTCVPREETELKLSIVRPVPPTPRRCHTEGQLYSPKLQRCVLHS